MPTLHTYFVDLHIHIGRTLSGKPVKITASNNLTLDSIIQEAVNRKGMNMVGIIDCHVPEIIREIEMKLERQECSESQDGGIVFDNLTILLGSEIEIYDENCHGPVHILAFFPTLATMKRFSLWMRGNMKNIMLSSQRMYVPGKELQKRVKELNGIFIPAHIFTPFKSLYGSGVKKSLTEVFIPQLIDAVELGLSADTTMAMQIDELKHYTFITNSDAHSIQKIGREYQKVCLAAPTFKELEKALKEQDGRRIEANYGLNPLIGKYYLTTCKKCRKPVDVKADLCPECGHKSLIKGVFDRLSEFNNGSNVTNRIRPPYIHQVQLSLLPGIGPKTLENLLNLFKTEMNIIHKVPENELLKVIPEKIVRYILSAREGILNVKAGGGGIYGKVE